MQTKAGSNLPDSNQIEQNDHYDKIRLEKIVASIKKDIILVDKKIIDNICDAIINYAPDGSTFEKLSNEIEILKNDHNLTDEVAKELRNIILEVK